MVVYAAGLIIWCLAVSLAYLKKSKETKSPSKGVFRYLYPVSRMLLDVWLTKCKVYHSEKIEQALKEVYVLENISKVKYEYFLGKTSKVVFILGLVMFMGLIVSYTEYVQERQPVTSVDRPQPGMGESQYHLTVQKEEQKERIAISIGEREYNIEEKQQKIQQAFEKLEESIIGENESLQYVTSDLQLENELDEVTIFWESENEELISADGEIRAVNIHEQGVEVNLKAILAFGGYEEEYLITVTLFPLSKQNEYSALQEELERQPPKTQLQVKLPDIWEGREITFYPVVERYSLYIGGVGLLVCVLLFFAQDRDMYEQVKQRERQMLLDYGEIVSKLSLLYQAGMTMTGAWEKIIQEYEKGVLSVKGVKKRKRYAYEEMKITWQHIRDGRATAQSMGEFGRRCRLNCYLKLGNLLEQNIHKGTKGLVGLLETERVEAKEIRADVTRKRGEEAGIKLLFPMIGMLGISIAIIVLPSFLSMEF